MLRYFSGTHLFFILFKICSKPISFAKLSIHLLVFPGGSVVNNLPVNAGDARDSDWTPGWGRSPGGGNSNPLQYSCLKNSMDRGAWWIQCMGLQRVGHGWVSTHTYICYPKSIHMCCLKRVLSYFKSDVNLKMGLPWLLTQSRIKTGWYWPKIDK